MGTPIDAVIFFSNNFLWWKSALKKPRY